MSSSTLPEIHHAMQGAVLRPREKVIRYLNDQFRNLDLSSGCRLPTTRTLAGKLNVSPSTVQAVFRSLARQGLIRSEVGNGSFLLKPPPVEKETLPAAMRIGITFGFAEETRKFEPWHLSIAGSVLSAASELTPSVAIIPLQFYPGGPVDAHRFLHTAIGQVDGIILRSMSGWSQVEAKLSDPCFPIVHLNPTGVTATRDFVSMNFFEAGFRAGAAFLAAGRKHVSFLHARSPSLAFSSTLRCAGLFAALGNAIGHTVEISVHHTPEPTQTSGYDLAKKLFEKTRTRPDAVYTTSDELARGIIDYCSKHKVDVPGDISVVAGSGVGPDDGLTRERHNTNRLGVELLQMVVARVEGKGRSQPAVYVDTDFGGGQSTLPEENNVLRVCKQSEV